MPSDWACRQKNLKNPDCSCYPAALLLGRPPTKNLKYPDCSCYPVAFLLGRPPRKSQVPRCLPTGPAARKISSSQMPSDWACRQKNLKRPDCSCYPATLLLGLLPNKNLKYPDCSCYPAAFLLGLPPRKSQVPRCLPTGPAARKISSTQIAVATMQPSYWACRQTNNSSNVNTGLINPPS